MVNLALVFDAARIDHVRQQLVQCTLGEGIAPTATAFARDPSFVESAAALQLIDDLA